MATDCCDECLACRKIEHGNHADVHWARPESKSRVITIDQTRDLMREIQLKPTEAEFKVAIIVAADRLNVQAANAFLKTLEEPPPKSVLILLSTEPQRILETILSRCLRLNFSGDGKRELNPAEQEWLEHFGALAAGEQKTLLGRYRLLDVLLQKARRNPRARGRITLPRARRSKNTTTWKRICATNGRTSWPPPSRPNTAASAPTCSCSCNGGCATSGCTPLAAGKELLTFPEIAGAETVARRISPRQALENLQTLEQTQRLLHTNVQEALALEVGLLKLHF